MWDTALATSPRNHRADPESIDLPRSGPPASHPFSAIAAMVGEKRLHDWTFRCTEYANPDDQYGQTDYTYKSFRGRDFFNGSVWDFVSEPREDTDVGLCSDILDPDGKRWHIGMVDFCFDPLAPPAATRCSETFGRTMKWSPTKYKFFTSGRSIHGYLVGDVLADEVRTGARAYSSFVGHLAGALLLNHADHRIVNDRWVGHKLEAGFCVLRWTANQRQYLALPELWAPPASAFWSS